MEVVKTTMIKMSYVVEVWSEENGLVEIKRFSSLDRAKKHFDYWMGYYTEDLKITLIWEYGVVYWTKKYTDEEILDTLNKESE